MYLHTNLCQTDSGKLPTALNPSNAAASPVSGIVIAGHGTDGRRSSLEDFVAREFSQRYDAKLDTFMPWLLGLSCDRQLAGVAGLRPAAGCTLFIEQYLDAPIEIALQTCTDQPVERNAIIEIGNLAGRHIGVNRALFPILTELTYMRGYDWVVCNATRAVQNSLRRLGIPMVPVQRAEPERLGDARFAWGRYYATESTVIAISTANAHEALLSKQQALAEACAKALILQYQHLPAA